MLEPSITQLVERSGVKVKNPFKAITLVKWLERHPGQDPKEAGFLVKDLMIEGEKVRCVLVRVLPEGEYDVDIESTVESLIKETLDDGENTLRGKQQIIKHEAAKARIVSSVIKKGETTKCLDDLKPASGRKEKEEKTGAPGEEEAEQANDSDDEEDKESSYDDVTDVQASDSILSDLLGDSLKTESKPPSGSLGPSPKAKPKAKPSPLSKNRSQAPASSASASGPSVATPKKRAAPPAESPEESPIQKRGRVGRPPAGGVTVESLKNSVGFRELQEKFDEVMAALAQEDIFKSSLTDPKQIKDFEAAAKTILKDVTACHKDAVLMDNKLAKRAACPPEVATDVKELRLKIKSVMDMMKGVALQTKFAKDQYDRLKAMWEQYDLPVPAALAVKAHKDP